MTDPLESLCRTGDLHREPPTPNEVSGLLSSARARLADARRTDLSLESRFDLAYNAAHGLALAAVRALGYRPRNRYLVFQLLEHTLEAPAKTWRFLAKCHERRNRVEYEGVVDVDERLVTDLIATAADLAEACLVRFPEPPD